MKFFRVKEVEDLHKNECIKDKCEMSWEDSILSVDRLIVFTSID